MNRMIFFVVFLRMERFSCLLMSHQDIQNKHFKAIYFFLLQSNNSEYDFLYIFFSWNSSCENKIFFECQNFVSSIILIKVRKILSQNQRYFNAFSKEEKTNIYLSYFCIMAWSEMFRENKDYAVNHAVFGCQYFRLS